jgi:hypothetical protein
MIVKKILKKIKELGLPSAATDQAIATVVVMGGKAHP